MTAPDDMILMTITLPGGGTKRVWRDPAKLTREEFLQAIADEQRAAAEENADAERMERRWREKRRADGGEG